MDKVKWGIIGCGDVTEVKSGPAFQKVANSELVAVMRRDAAKALDYAKRHNVPNWYSNADLLINDPSVNAIYVATPPDTHAFYAKKAIAAGKPVYIEKPMCKTFAECEEVIAMANKKNVQVFVAYYRRMLPGFVKVKTLLESGVIGDISMVNIQLFKSFPESKSEQSSWRTKPEIAGGGHFYDLASHQFDFLDYILGSIEEVKSIVANQSSNYEAEDILSVSFLLKNGVLGNGTWCFNSSDINNTDNFTVYGSIGRIEFSTFEFSPIKLITEKGIEEFDFPKPDHVQFDLIEQIVNDLRGEDKAVSTGISGAVSNKVLEQIVKEYYTRTKRTI